MLGSFLMGTNSPVIGKELIFQKRFLGLVTLASIISPSRKLKSKQAIFQLPFISGCGHEWYA
jgi:hypothetical protein